MADLFQLSPKAADYKARVERFMDEHVYPNEASLYHTAETQPDQWEPLALLEELKAKAKAEGLWNLFLPDSEYGARLTNLEYAPLAEIMGRSHWGLKSSTAPRPTPATWKFWSRYGNPAQKEQWLKPLLEGEIRSGFAMTEPDVASSDATNISISASKRTAAITSSMAANGGLPAQATSAAKFSSLWVRRIPAIQTRTSSNQCSRADGRAGRGKSADATGIRLLETHRTAMQR